MSYALVVDDEIQSVGKLPQAATRLDSGGWVLGLQNASVDLQQACGYYEVVETPPLEDTATTTHDRTVQLIEGTPTVVWVERDKTQSELNSDAAIAAQQEAFSRARSANSLASFRDALIDVGLI